MLMEELIKVAMVDDDPMIRTLYKTLINDTEGMICVAEFEGSKETVDELANSSVDVILMDVDMPKMNGIDCVRNIREKNKEIPIVMLTVNEDSELIFNSLCNGANGYLVKGLRPEKLTNGIIEVYKGGAPMSASIARKVVDSFKITKSAVLTGREQEVLQLLCDGDNYKQAAAKLFISAHTVKRHIRNIYEKLQVNSRAELVQKAYRENLVR
ncbi:DNA-binding response regulator [Portibacter lacus]|uniref:DNA-binding response regulator n=2 Tax=Portibacter lacus TaxID=1099794 RepID=A0AA37SR30_9BACT|nr:DNA-binding response regulator [Portibacter lacus]